MSEIKVLLAKNFEPEKLDAEGWLMSEKLDGIRAVWTNGALFTRNGKPINAPESFIENFPKDVVLDGELWIGHGYENFSKVSGIARKKVPIESEWKSVKYLVFDIIEPSLKYEQRVKKYNTVIEKAGVKWLVPVKITVAKNNDHVFTYLSKVESHGGEGVMLRKPGSLYEGKRSSTLLKVKSFTDEEGRLVGYSDGTGKYKGMVGALILKISGDVEVMVGTGLDDATRAKPPKIGSMIKFKYFEKSAAGVPRFPVFIEVRTDL
jgi:DNA ligase-1